MIRACYVVLASLALTGCYRNWPQVDALTNKVTCETTKSQASSLAQKFDATVAWDPTYLVLSVVKEQDALALQFVPVTYGSKVLRLDTLSVARSNIRYFGLHRQQGDVEVLLRCKS
ncbi:MAG: hypothetical protein HRU23_01335 [Gammaproteobacteria bacterium]|nr:hypothetical protein [Gammaproteobacteria bacterium]